MAEKYMVTKSIDQAEENKVSAKIIYELSYNTEYLNIRGCCGRDTADDRENPPFHYTCLVDVSHTLTLNWQKETWANLQQQNAQVCPIGNI